MTKLFGWELPITELELVTLSGFLIVVVQSLGSFFQRLPTDRLESKVNGAGRPTTLSRATGSR